jgi:hypothetical protein
MTEQLRTAASPRLCAYLVSARLQPTFIPWQRLWRPTLPSRGLRWYSIIAATADPNMTAIPTTTRFLWALADLSAVIIAKVQIYSAEAGSFQFFQGPAMPNGSDRPPLETISLLAGTTLRRRKIGTRRHTRSLDPCIAPLPPGGLQNSAGVAAFWLDGPFVQTTATCVRFATPNLRMICRT